MTRVQNRTPLETILSTLESCALRNRESASLHEPLFGGNEWAYVKECLDTGWVSSTGAFVDRFERRLEDFTGIPSVASVVNGTSALHLCLKLIGVEPNDEVLVPDLAFVAVANAVTYCGAIPHFVDCDTSTLGVHPRKLEAWLTDMGEIRKGRFFNKQSGRTIKALIAVHTFGHPVDLDTLSEICDRFHLDLIEDCAESLGSFYKNCHTGQWGRFAAFSFNGNKVLTTGGGGAVATKDKNAGQLVKHLTTTAKVSHPWKYDHDQVGYNYRLPNLNAALGCAQLEQLPDFLEKKRALALRYQNAFAGMSGVRFFTEPEFAKSNYWLNAILLDDANDRDELLRKSHEVGVKARPSWTLLHRLPMYQNCPRMDVSTAENIESRLINIPSSAFL